MPFRGRFIINRVETNDERQELVELGITLRIDCDIEERAKNSVKHILEACDGARCAVGFIQARNLYHPADLRAGKAVADDPVSQLRPLS